MRHISCQGALLRAIRFAPRCGLFAILFTLLSSAPLAQGSIQETITDEGLRVWSFPDDGGDRFLLMVLVGSGARQEDERKTGLAHLLEHVLLGSTREWSKPESRDRLDAIGGVNNGYTNHDVTTFYLRCPSASWREAVEWLAAHLVDPALNQSDVDDERKIVFEEIDMRQSHAGPNPLGSLLYPDHALGRVIGGDQWGIEDLERDDLREFYAENYRSINMAIGFAGKVPHEECTQKILREFAGLGATGELSDIDPVVAETGLIRMPGGDDASAWMLRGYHLPTEGAVEKAAQLVIENYLGNRSFEVVREENQLSYAPTTSLAHFADTTRFDFSLQVSEGSNLSQVEEIFDGLVLELSEPKLSALASAKREAAATLVVNNFEDLGLAMELSWFMRRAGQSPTDLERALASLEPQQVADYAEAHLIEDNRFTLTNGPIGGATWLSRIFGVLILLVVVDAMRGFAWTHALRARWENRHEIRAAKKARKARVKGKQSSIRQMPGGDIEKSFQDFFEREDEHES